MGIGRFGRIDHEDDGTIDVAEFTSMLPQLERWGVRIVDAAAEFAAIDSDGRGELDFGEFKEWALRKQLDLEEDDD